MKQWGLGRWGALLAVLTLLVSAGVLVPLGAQAQGKKVWGLVTDCANTNPVGATVTLADAQAQLADIQTTASGATGFYSFSDPTPAYYRVRIQPTGFTYFTGESAVFRFDGMTNVRVDVCVNRMLDRNRWLNLTVVDAQPAAISGEAPTFQEFSRGPENATLPVGRPRYNTATNILQLDTKPLNWGSETLVFVDGSNPNGITLTSPSDYSYDTAQAFAGQVLITNLTVQVELSNTLTGGAPRGWLTATYMNVSQSSNLAHGQILSSTFYNGGVPMTPPWGTLTLNNETGVINITGNWRFGVDSLTVDYSWLGAIAGATVTVFAQKEPISTPLTTNSAGKAYARVWSGGTFDVKVEANTYQTVLRNYAAVAADITDTITMYRGWVVRAIAIDEDINPILASQGLTGVLVNTTAANSLVGVLPGQAEDLQVSFWAPNGNFLLILDANGKTAYKQNIVVNGANQTVVAELKNSPKELYTTEVAFAGNNDWNNITVYRNVTLLEDSVFPGIQNGNLRNLRWQLDLKFGNANGNLTDANEMQRVENYIHDAGPFYVVSNNLLTVNGKTYKSDPNNTTYTATATNGPGSNFTINTSQTYTLTDTTKWIAKNQSRYYVNVTTRADQNVTVYGNNTYFVNLPKGYEMTSKTTTGNVVTRGFTRVEVDPAADALVANPRVNMVVEKSLTGVARAEVEGPVGKVAVQPPADQSKYVAWVANDTAIVFSANKTTDRQNQAINVKDSNFTWRFKNNTDRTVMGYGIWTTYNYSNIGGRFTVNLTVTQVNPTNVTYRDITVIVDNIAPTAVIRTNRTDKATPVLNPPHLYVNETLFTTFIGTNSTDDLYSGSPDKGKVVEWDWDFESDGIIDQRVGTPRWNYSKPGNYTLTLSVIDSVGHKSANQTMAVTVNDTIAPQVDVVILDPSNDWSVATELIEGHNYTFNASKTTDDSLKHAWDNVNLTYVFNWGDGTNATTFPLLRGKNDTLNVTHIYAKFNTNYSLSIEATDAAGNHGWLNESKVVVANTTAHPDLSIILNTLTVSPSNPEEGQQVKFSINFTNANNKATARGLKVSLTMVVSGADQDQTISDKQWSVTELLAGKNATVTFTWTAPSVGNKSLTIKVWDEDEPTQWMTGNSQTTSLVVKEAGWKLWAIIGGFVFVVIGLPIIYYAVRKVRAGEWTLRRKKGEDEEEEDEEDEDEGKDRGGKKRL